MNAEAPKSLIVEGPIGVGKSTLVKHLADQLGMQAVLERGGENPFLPMFYQNPARHALPTQISFLFQRQNLFKQLKQGDLFKPVPWISDFMLAKDHLFAKQTLNEEEFSLYEKIYRLIAADAPQPALMIYLQAPVDVLLQRVYQRGIAYEEGVTAGYLQRICDAYVEFFHHYDNSPLLIINAANCDFRDEDHMERLMSHIRSRHRGRQYFNPGGTQQLL